MVNVWTNVCSDPSSRCRDILNLNVWKAADFSSDSKSIFNSWKQVFAWKLNSLGICCMCSLACCISSMKNSKRALKQHSKITLHNTFTAATSWEETYRALSPLGSLLAQRVTISGWRCRSEWHGCSWGMWGIPLVNTSCSDGHRTLISPCPLPPLIIIMVRYSLNAPSSSSICFSCGLCSLMAGGVTSAGGFCLPEAPHGLLFTLIPPNGQTEPALILLYKVQWLSNVNNLKGSFCTTSPGSFWS